jgi:hypothetical protein
MKRGKAWSRGDKIGFGSLLVGIVAVVIALLIPEVRVWLRLQKPVAPPSAVSTSKPPHPLVIPSTQPTAEPPPPPKVNQHSKSNVKGYSNVVGNNVTGSGNVTGNNNQITVPAPVIVEPGSIGITGGTVTNPTVNNFGPPPLPTPTVTICVPPSVADGEKYTTILRLRTSGKIVQPYYAFIFDSPVLNGSAVMDRHAFGVQQGRADKQPNPDRSYVFRVTSIDFGTTVWAPNEEIKVTIPSEHPIKLVNLLYGSEESPLMEYIVYKCD